MRLCNSRIPEEHLVCYQMSQHNWVIIKMLYRWLRSSLWCWHRSRIGFVTPSVGEVSLGPLGNTHHNKPCKQKTNELVTRWCVTQRVKRLAGNEIELGIEIPTIESRASNIPTRQRELYTGLPESLTSWFIRWDHRGTCGNQYGYPDPAIGYWPGSVSVMSTWFPNPQGLHT